MWRRLFGLILVVVGFIHLGCLNMVPVEKHKSSTKIITSFNLTNPISNGIISEYTHKINLIVPYKTEISSLVPIITYSGSKIVPESGVAQDFSTPKTYIVTAEDGTTQNYIVVVTIAAITPTLLSDTKFNGYFSYSYYWEDSSGIEEKSEYTSFDFDGSNKVFYYTKHSRYSITYGWSYSGDYPGDYYAWYLEFEILNGMYRERLWDNPYSEWSNWERYEFSNNGNTLTLYNYYNIIGNDTILTLSSSSNSRSLAQYKDSVDIYNSYINEINNRRYYHLK